MKTPMTFRLLPDIAEYLRSTDNQAVEIETAVRRSSGYKVWKAMEAENASAKKAKGRGRKDRRVRRGSSGRAGD